MATMYCALCNRAVEAKRQIGAGTIIVAVLTAGVSLVAIPFYRKRCAICKSAAVTAVGPGQTAIGSGIFPPGRLGDVEKRMQAMESELEAANFELDRLRTERDFYRDLLGDRVHDREPPRKQR